MVQGGKRWIKLRKCEDRNRGQSDWKVRERRQRLEEEKVKKKVKDHWL